jgi:hypothetical protein
VLDFHALCHNPAGFKPLPHRRSCNRASIIDISNN